MKKMHTKLAPELCCDKCDLKFYNKIQLYDHHEQFHRLDEKKGKNLEKTCKICKICKREFDSKAILPKTCCVRTHLVEWRINNNYSLISSRNCITYLLLPLKLFKFTWQQRTAPL